MADISKINVNGTVYDIKDETARQSGGSGGGHKILNSSGTEMTQRSKLQFANSTVTDDSTNDKTIVMPNNILTTTVDPGEGSALATNCILVVIEE